MPDIFDNVLTKASSIYNLVKKIGNSDLLNEISDLKIELADIKSAYADLENENTRLKAALDGKGSSFGAAPVVRT
jgi:hypothetical protein